MIDAPVTINEVGSSMPITIPGWEELPASGITAIDWQSNWFRRGDGTTPATVPDVALFFTINDQPLVFRLKTTSEQRPIETRSMALGLSVPAQLDMIKEQLAISVTQLAELFGVTRKSVYDWYEGKGPRTNMATRISSLLDVISRYDQSDLSTLKAAWNIEDAGDSFRTILQSDTLAGTDLTAALTAKLNGLFVEMSTMANPKSRIGRAFIGDSSLADIDRRSDAT